jgi:putative DNA primase/helicase
MNQKNGVPLSEAPRKKHAAKQADFLAENTAWDRLAQLQLEQPVLIIAGDLALCEQIGDDAFFRLAASRPVPEWGWRQWERQRKTGEPKFIPMGAITSPQTYPAIKERPCFRCYDAPFKRGNRDFKAGVYRHVTEEDKDTKIEVPVDLWICSLLRVLFIVRTESGSEHGYLIEYVPHGESQPRRMVMSQALLLGRGDEALRELRAIGVSVLGANARHVCEYLDAEHLRFSAIEPTDFWTRTKVVGWYPVGKRFVLPNQVIGAQEGVWFSGKPDDVLYNAGGKFEDWKTQIAEPCIDNYYLQFALSCGFAGPLLEPLNIPGLGFHYYGDSTTGKSTALTIAASVWGSPEPGRFLLSWRSTSNGLEAQAASRSSTLIPLDESHQADPKVLDDAVYLLLNGISKARMKKDIAASEITSWRNAVLSSGERSIETHQAAAKIDHKVGQTVRMIDVPVVKNQYGLFSDIHGAKNGAEFSDALRKAAGENYGHAGIKFIAELISRYLGLSLPARLDAALQNFEKVGTLGAQDWRVARSFALAAVPGELAIEWAIIPWKTDSALMAAMEIFDQWKQTQPQTAKNKEDAQILKSLLDFLGAYGDTRFTDIKPKTFMDYTVKPPVRKKSEEQSIPKGINRAGYWEEDTSGKRIYMLYPAALKEAAGQFERERILDALSAAGALAATGTGSEKAKRRRTPDGGNPKLYWIDPEKLEP